MKDHFFTMVVVRDAVTGQHMLFQAPQLMRVYAGDIAEFMGKRGEVVTAESTYDNSPQYRFIQKLLGLIGEPPMLDYIYHRELIEGSDAWRRETENEEAEENDCEDTHEE